MADETISEKCETLYNKLNSFVTSVINRDVTPKISNLNTEVWGSNTQTGDSRIDTLESDVTSLDTSITNITATESITITPSNVGDANPMTLTLLGGKFVKLHWVDNKVTVSSSNINSYKVLGTLPAKYRPPTQIWFTQAHQLHMDTGLKTSLAIMTNGEVQLYCWWTGTNKATPCVFTGVYALF